MVFLAESKICNPKLYLVACSALDAVASSAASERDFPVAGKIKRKDRSSLPPRHLEMNTVVWENARSVSKAW